MKHLTNFLLALGSTCLCFSQAWGEGCTCPPTPPLNIAYQTADIAIIGKVEKISESVYRQGYLEVRFYVMKKFKWPEELGGDSAILYTRPKPEDCGYPFMRDQDYIVYATGNPAGLTVTKCSRTNVLDNVLDDIDPLTAISTGKPLPKAEPFPAITPAPRPKAPEGIPLKRGF